MKHCNLKFVLPVLMAGFTLGIVGDFTTSSVAQTASANLVVTATVPTECTIAGANMAFGTYTGLEVPSQAPIDVTCQSESTPWTIGADVGQNAINCVRFMADGQNNLLQYTLYVDPNFTQVLGSADGGPCDTGFDFAGQGSNTDPTVFGLVAEGQNVPPGSYSDTVVMTISF